MLNITIPAVEQYDEVKQEFVTSKKEQVLTLEHSLVSISKWECKWNKAFLTNRSKTYEEMIDYFRCMTITQNVDVSVYKFIDKNIFGQIRQYMDLPMTAVKFHDFNSDSHVRDTMTAEIIYYKMLNYGIPFECQKWHLNRLLALIRVCDIKSTPHKKMSMKEIATRNSALNEQRRKQLNSRG